MMIKKAANKEDKEDYRRILNEVHGRRMGWIKASQIIDRYDAYAEHFLAVKDKRPLAVVRAIYESPFGFLIEEIFGFRFPNCESRKYRKKLQKIKRSEIIEISQAASLEPGNQMSLHLMKAVFYYAQSKGGRVFCSAMDMHMFLLSFKLHFPFEPIGIAKFWRGGWVMPVVLFLEDLIKELKKSDPECLKYFFEKNNLTGRWE